jgi:hypothetical protein
VRGAWCVGEESGREKRAYQSPLILREFFYAHREQQTLFAGHTERIVIVHNARPRYHPKGH